MGFNKRYISLSNIINIYAVDNKPEDVIHYVTSVDAMLTMESDKLLNNIVEACVNKDTTLVKKLIDNYIYNK